jgi:hypothetical protein
MAKRRQFGQKVTAASVGKRMMLTPQITDKSTQFDFASLEEDFGIANAVEPL